MDIKSTITIIMTCCNRADKTKKCLESLDSDAIDMNYIVVDDGSSDGTSEVLRSFAEEKHREMELLNGDGKLFWSGGMRCAMNVALGREKETDYVLLVNDDVEFYEATVERMVTMAVLNPGYCISGATCDKNGKRTYGAVRYDFRHAKPTNIEIEDEDRDCDAANMNAFLMPYHIFKGAGKFDEHYNHAMADYDYSFTIKRLGYKIMLTDYYVGKCESNEISGTWKDNTLSRANRVRLKETPKGLPYKEWYYYLKKNFGLRCAVWHSITPYIRIFIGK